MKNFNEPFTFNSFDDVKNDNSIIWEAVKKELPNVMEQELTEQQRACLDCIFYGGLNQVQTAEKLGIAQPTVHRHTKRAMAILLNRLSYAMKIAKTVACYYENEM